MAKAVGHLKGLTLRYPNEIGVYFYSTIQHTIVLAELQFVTGNTLPDSGASVLLRLI
jgi:hypothetical protein